MYPQQMCDFVAWTITRWSLIGKAQLPLYAGQYETIDLENGISNYFHWLFLLAVWLAVKG